MRDKTTQGTENLAEKDHVTTETILVIGTTAEVARETETMQEVKTSPEIGMMLKTKSCVTGVRKAHITLSDATTARQFATIATNQATSLVHVEHVQLGRLVIPNRTRRLSQGDKIQP